MDSVRNSFGSTPFSRGTKPGLLQMPSSRATVYLDQSTPPAALWAKNRAAGELGDVPEWVMLKASKSEQSMSARTGFAAPAQTTEGLQPTKSPNADGGRKPSTTATTLTPSAATRPSPEGIFTSTLRSLPSETYKPNRLRKFSFEETKDKAVTLAAALRQAQESCVAAKQADDAKKMDVANGAHKMVAKSDDDWETVEGAAVESDWVLVDRE